MFAFTLHSNVQLIFENLKAFFQFHNVHYISFKEQILKQNTNNIKKKSYGKIKIKSENILFLLFY